MPLTAAGPLTSSLLGLRTILAQSADFQAFVGAADAAEAEAKVHFFDYEAEPEDLAAERPMATIWLADQFAMEAIAWGSSTMLDPGGDLVLEIQSADEDAADREAGYFAFCTWLDKVLKALRDAAGVSDALTIGSIRFLWGPRRSPPQDDPSTGGYWHCGLLVSWGGRGGRG